MKIVKGEKKTIYFIQGHGEKNIDDTEKTGYSTAKAGLEKDNYVVKTSEPCSGRQSAGRCFRSGDGRPTSEPFPNELDLIDGFLNKGGSAAIFLDPPPAPRCTIS